MKPDQLLNLFTSHFNMTELEGLCFDLGVNHEEIPGHNQTLDAFARNLILFFKVKKRLPELIVRCRELRPDASWPDDDSLPDFSAWDAAAIDDKELENYLSWVQTQYNTMRVLSMTQPLSLQTLYTDVFLLDKSEYWQKQGIDELEKAFARRKGWERGDRIQGGKLLARANRFFIVGQPGAGKTTFSNWLALQAVQNYSVGQRIPVYLALRRFNTWNDSLLSLLAHELELGGIVTSQEKMKGLLQQGILLVLLDGLDEVLAEQRDALNDQIDDLAKWSDDNQIIITCRPHAETRRFEHFNYVQMADFTEDQVEHFVRHWFGDGKLADNLLSDLRKSEHKTIRELTCTPLLLALLCIGYRTEPTFPKRKDQLYERALQVVLQQWDEERGVERESGYGQLSLERKQALLAYVAYETFSQGQLFITETDLARHVVDFWRNWRQEEVERQIAEYGRPYPPELPLKEIVPRKIIREIAAQHGLLVEQLTGVFSFSHLTLQEYFAALYVVENENGGLIERLMPFWSDDRWRELFLLTAGMLADATGFFELFLQTVDQMVAGDGQVEACLKWVEDKGAQTQLPYKFAATRAFLLSSIIDFYLDCARDRAFANNRDTPRNIDLALAVALSQNFNIDLDLYYYLDRARDRALILARVLDLNLDLTLGLDYFLALALYRNFALVLIHGLDLALKAAEHLELERMQLDLQALTVPEDLTVLEERQTFIQKFALILDEYRENWDPYQQVKLDEQEIDPFSKLSSEQLNKVFQYLSANLLLASCLEVAYVPNRQAIEDRILLPPSP